VRPINLLPEKHRPRGSTPGEGAGGIVALGVLGGLLLAVVLFVLSANQLSSRKDDLTRTQNETKQATAQADALKSYGNFAEIKQARVLSVRDLADGRFDWERAMRELAFLLPDEVWLTAADASLLPDATVVAGSPGAIAGPSLHVVGCARRQPDVAVTLLRLRRIHRAADVTLAESTRAQDAGEGGATGSAVDEGCGENFQFDATVAFEAAPVATPPGEKDPVPAKLGGGS